MTQNEQLIAIGTELSESLSELTAGQATIIADIAAANSAAGNVIPDSTIQALQTSADGIKAVADALNAAVNPTPAEPIPDAPQA